MTEPVPPPTRVFRVRVELGDEVGDDEVQADLARDPGHRLQELQVRVSRNASGRTEVGLTVPGPDVWASALTAMALLRQSGYPLRALHVLTQDDSPERPAA